MGNLLLFVGREDFNGYAYLLEHRLLHGWFIYLAEAGLVVMVILHIISTVSVRLREPRGAGHALLQDGGGRRHQPEVHGLAVDADHRARSSWSSCVLHIRMFKFGPAEVIEVAEGIHYRDLYSLVVRTFKVWWIALGYAAVMVMLGTHLRHGIWSGIQSLGASNPKFLPAIYIGGIVMAAILALGYILLPICIWLFFDDPTLDGRRVMATKQTASRLDARIPGGPLEEKWSRSCETCRSCPPPTSASTP